MELTHSFTVPASVEDAWAAFNDLDRIAPCFPGASLSSYDGESFTGACKVKVGPISLQYTGSGKFLSRDEGAHRAVVEAKGKDRRGNGTATATVTASLEAAEGSSTLVTVQTDLAITGKPAQFGRGVMQDVGDKLLGQFASCLERKLANGAGDDAGSTAAEGTTGDVAAVEATTGGIAAAAGTTADGRVPSAGAADADSASTTSIPEADGASADAGAAATSSQAAHVDRPGGCAGPTDAPGQPEEAGGDADHESGKHRATGAPSTSPVADFAEPAELDLGATVLPILARRYAPFLGAALVLLVLLRVLVRRRR